MAQGFDIAKAGWLYRESSVLHRWKRNWVVLDKLGDLRYFETPDHPVAEERIVMRATVSKIRTGYECGSVSLPDHLSKGCLLRLDMKDGSSLTLCAETADDMKAWQIALEEARTLYSQPGYVGNTTVYSSPVNTTTVIGAPGYYGGYINYGGYPGRVISTPGVTVLNPPSQTTVIPNGLNGATVVAAPPQQVVYMNAPYRYRSGVFGPYLW